MRSKRLVQSTHAFGQPSALDDQHKILVDVRSHYESTASTPEEEHYTFSYTVTITNQGDSAVTILGRHWYITDANGLLREVHGAGVVGEQPHLQPGESFQYSSGIILETPVGSMQGFYHILSERGDNFETEIPAFSLAKPDMVH